MTLRKRRVPKIGDRVTVNGQTGEFTVSSVNRMAESVELKPLGQDFALSTIAWDALRFLSPRAANR
jgi:hypothetical protein